MPSFWSFFLPSKTRKSTRYDAMISPVADGTQLWQIPAPSLGQTRSRASAFGGGQRLQRRTAERNKIKREDLINVLSHASPMASSPDLLEDETIPGKAIVLKMPDKSLKTYFIPLPADIDGLKRRTVQLFGLLDEVDVFSRLEFELFAFGVIPTSASLPLLKDREVVYVNLLPPRPPTPFSLTLAPSRPENSLVAEVRRPGTGQPYEVVYTSQTLVPPDPQQSTFDDNHDVGPSRKPRKGSRFKEHMSGRSSRHSRRWSFGETDNPRDTGKAPENIPSNVEVTEIDGAVSDPGGSNPFQGESTENRC